MKPQCWLASGGSRPALGAMPLPTPPSGDTLLSRGAGITPDPGGDLSDQVLAHPPAVTGPRATPLTKPTPGTSRTLQTRFCLEKRFLFLIEDSWPKKYFWETWQFSLEGISNVKSFPDMFLRQMVCDCLSDTHYFYCKIETKQPISRQQCPSH